MFDVLFRRLPDLEPADDDAAAVPGVELHRRPRGDARAVHADGPLAAAGSDSFRPDDRLSGVMAESGPCTRCRHGRQEVVLAFDSGQAPLRHTRGPAESCFLPDLTRFTGSRCAGPDPQRLVRVVPLGGPSLERGFSPPDVGLGYRAPRAPRLARSTGQATRPPGSIDAPGGVRERPNRHAWKACVGQLTVGSNPTPSAADRFAWSERVCHGSACAV